MIQFFRIFFLTFILQFFFYSSAFTSTTSSEFKIWLNDYKKIALKEGISENTINLVFKDIKFIEKVIVYDRKQPEFYEDTITYVSKRANNSRKNQAEKLYKKNKDLLNQIEKEFNVEKEILLALWGIETNFGKHVGKMHILSSLATLSFDKRRSEFFSKQLIIILKLIDKKIIDHKKLYGSWAGAYGNFQFMPSTIKSYAIDFDENNKIELKESVEDSFASAANYINKIGWIMGEPCFYRIRMNKKINKKYINLSARKLTRKMSISKWKKKGLVNFDGSEIDGDFKAALIQPDGKPDSPAYLVFNNYEKILKWNRSLRFGVSVCTLANMIKI